MLPSLNVPHLPEVAQAAEGLFIQLVFHNLPLQINPWCSSQQCTESWLATEGRELQTSDFSFFVQLGVGSSHCGVSNFKLGYTHFL